MAERTADEALLEAVAASATASLHCLAAAERAVEEGRFNVAKVLRAAAHAARLRGLNAARSLAQHASPAQALATTQGVLGRRSIPPEKPDALDDILTRALRSLEANPDVLETDVAQTLWGCQVCGFVVEGALPATCAGCGALPFEFDWFGPFYSATHERLGRRMPGEIVSILSDSPGRLTSLLGGVSEEQLTRRPSADEWCMKEIAGHLVDVTALFCARVRTVLEAPTPPPLVDSLPPWRILESRNYPALASAVIADRFGAVTREALGVIGGLDAAAWGRYGIVARRVTTILDLGTWVANHNVAHLAQIAALRQSFP